MQLILASTSPRRRELLATLGIPFKVVAPRFEETTTALPPHQEALYFAEQKARSVAADHPGSLILASDTLVACQGHKLGKPRGEAEAQEMLHLLSGRDHELFTALVLLNAASGEERKHIEKAIVSFHPLTSQQIVDYIATGEPMDKAGAYAVQGIGKSLVAKVDGDINAVIGLPLEPIQQWLKDCS